MRERGRGMSEKRDMAKEKQWKDGDKGGGSEEEG